MTSDAPAAFVGVSGGIVALLSLGRFPGLVFSSLVALGFPWVLFALTAVSNALHSVDVPGGIAAPLGLCWTTWGLGTVWSPLGFKFLVEVSFGGAQSSALLVIFVFTSRFALLVSRQTVLVPGFLCSCP